MDFGVAVLLVGVWVLGQPLGLAAFEAPPCLKPNGTVMEVNYTIPPDMLKWAKEGVEAHNKFRKKHGVPPLVLNPKMCKSAQWAANRIAVDDIADFTSTIYPYLMSCGELLHTSVGLHLKPASHYVQDWYDEVKYYDFSKHKAKPERETFRFQQVVWKGTKEMCMTHAQALSGQHYIAAHYYPPGNYPGADAEHVFNSANHDPIKTRIIFILILLCTLFF